MKYFGHFYLPAGQQECDPELSDALKRKARFGFGGRAMCMGLDGLWVSGHDHADLVAKVSIPDVQGETAEVLVPFHEATPRALLARNELDNLVGLAWHKGQLKALWNEYYHVDGHDGDRKSLWDGDGLVALGEGSLKQHAGYLTVADGSLWCGRSDGAGSSGVTHGPTLYKVTPQNRLVRIIEHVREDWTNADRYTAIAFLPGRVVWLVQKATGPVWYGSRFGPNGEYDPWNGSKGYHTTTREVWLLPYVYTTAPGADVIAKDPIVLGDFHESSRCGGMAFDGRFLYVHELWPPERMGGSYPGERPRIHIYDLIEEPEPEKTLEVRVIAKDGVYGGKIPKLEV